MEKIHRRSIIVKSVTQTKQFNRELKKCKKRGYNLDELDNIVLILMQGKKLSKDKHNHKLRGKYKGYCECHIAPDWLLIYKINDEQLLLARTGTHSDLFE